MDNNYKFNHDNFKKLVNDNHFDAAAIAKELHLNVQTVESWLTKGVTPYGACITGLCKLLHCKPGDLYNSNLASEEKPVSEVMPAPVFTEAPLPAQDEFYGIKKPKGNILLNKRSTEKPEKIKNDTQPTNTESDIPANESGKEPAKKNDKKNPDTAPALPTPESHTRKRPVTTQKTTTSSSATKADARKEALLQAMKEAKFNAKDVNKKMTSEQAEAWTKSLLESYRSSIDGMFSHLAAISANSVSIAFEPQQPEISPRLAELLEIAKGSSDQGIELAIDILKKLRK